ncbi:MAG: hypothetical protein HY548_07325 [Elusimicrobia bacterium]|nr:hypothetical protein [Elusimicrobiota bacterium]
MKKFFALLAVLMFAGSVSGRAGILGLENITPDASLEILGQRANNETDANDGAKDTRGNVITRLRVGLNAGITEGVRGRIEALRNSNTGGAVVQYGSGRPSSIAATEGAIAFQNAYIDIDGMLTLDKFRLGRQYGGRPGDLLVFFGPYNDDALSVQALDALSVEKKIGPVKTMFATGKVREDDTAPGAAGVSETDADDVLGDVNAGWLVLGSDELIPNLRVPLEIGYYQASNQGAVAESDNINLSIIDLRAGVDLMEEALKLGLEYAVNGGQDNNGPTGAAKSDYKGNALLLKALYDNNDAGWGGHLHYAMASGDDTGNDDKAFHDFSVAGWAVSDFRYGEILTNSNALGFGPGLDTGAGGPGISLFNLGGYFNLPVFENRLTATADLTMAEADKVPSGADDGIGTEFDLALHYFHSDSVRASIGYALASPEKGIASGFAAPTPPNTPTDNITKLFAKIMVKWGAERRLY